MRLVSTTLAGTGTDAIIGDAIRSVVGLVDACIVIDTCPEESEPIVRAARRAIAGTSTPLLFARWPWRDDFAAARNAALGFATETGAEWALTCDTDERIHPNGEDLDAALSAPVGAWMARDQGQGALKERLIRLPAAQLYRGRTHEAYEGHLDPRGRGTLERLAYSELPKDAARNAAKFARDDRLLRAEIADAPEQSRWHFYLGVTLRGMGRLAEAVEEFKRCAILSRWPEEAGWACWEAANLLHILGRHEEALQACASGLMRYPGIAELCWTAARCCLALGRRDEAIDWAKLARVHGHAGDGVALRRRILWRVERALGSGPDEVMRGLQPPSSASHDST